MGGTCYMSHCPATKKTDSAGRTNSEICNTKKSKSTRHKLVWPSAVGNPDWTEKTTSDTKITFLNINRYFSHQYTANHVSIAPKVFITSYTMPIL